MNLKNRKLREFLRHLIRSVAFWITAMALFGFVRYFGIEDEIGISIAKSYTELYNFSRILILFMLSGSLMGVLYAAIEYLIGTYLTLRISLVWSVAIQIVLVFVAAIVLADGIFRLASLSRDISLNLHLGWWYEDRTFFPVLAYIPFASFVFSMYIVVSDSFSNGLFLKLMLGHYKKPREEWRMFMFLDLKNSTSIAERIGHFKFSQLIQDCFYDLNEIILSYEAEIYQYVGDEAVLTWPYAKGMAKNNSLHLFFAFLQHIEDKKEVYLKKYGMVPSFKAGLHGGSVMASAVGVFKKELAYHGDVVNTAARIQGECNRHEVPILISEKLTEDIRVDGAFSTEFIGSLRLKGKEKEVRIHTVKMK
ncbi:MAG: adenylate/guanylate cyclase domain-containing protein [Bacteroidota bacterium]